MKLSLSSTLLPLLALAATHGAHAQITCATSGGSPTTADAHQCDIQMAGLSGNICQNGQSNPPFCKNIWTYGTASVNLCGTFNACITWAQASNAVYNLANRCSNGVRSGGSIQVNSALHIDLYHS